MRTTVSLHKSNLNRYKTGLYLTIIYTFFNNFGLPDGLTFMSILSPLFYLWLVKKRRKFIVLKFSLPYLLLSLFQGLNGIELATDFLRSSILYFTIYIFIYTVYIFISNPSNFTLLPKYFKTTVLINLLFTIIAFSTLYTPFDKTFWYYNELTVVLNFPRLKLLSTESSIYAQTFIPIFFYYFMTTYYNGLTYNPKMLFLSILPILLSFSMGAYLTIPLVLLLFCIIKFYQQPKSYINFRFASVLVYSLIILLCFLILIYPDNFFTNRVNNIFNGEDSSTNGRTFESFLLAYKIAEKKSLFFGVGAGQLKIIGNDIINMYYQYQEGSSNNIRQAVRIPNSVAETFAIFGFVGLFFRFGVIITLFIRTKVLTSSYRTLVFLYAFISQFTGGNVIYLAEYILWILAFSPILPDDVFSRRTLALQKTNSMMKEKISPVKKQYTYESD
ncbi:hypothetical protein GCM10027341_53680 [Spirosoma knui]